MDTYVRTYIHTYIHTHTHTGKVQSKLALCTPRMCTRSEATGLFINLGTRWSLSGQLHAPAVLLLGKKALVATEYDKGWNSEAVWTFWTRGQSIISATHRTTIICTVRLVRLGGPHRSGLGPRPVHVQYLVEKVAHGQIFFPVIRLCSVSSIPQMLHTN